MRAGDIIRRLRSFVRKSDGVKSTFDVNDVVRDAATILTPLTLRTNASVCLELVELPAVVHADRVQLEQVVVNLVRNALEAVADSDIRKVTVRTYLTVDMVQISVEDTGAGVPEQAADKLFDAFFTSKESGLGMGLAISRTIVEAHNGRIWTTRRREGGLIVHFTLPQC